MRLLALTAVSLVGCTSEPTVDLTLRSELQARTDGVAIHDGGELAEAGMGEALCVVDTPAAIVVGDRDLADGPDKLLDAHRDLALATAGGQLHQVSTAQLANLDTSVVFDVDAIDARVLSDGIVALYAVDGHCAVAYDTSAGRSGWRLDDLSCTGPVGFTADRSSGTAWIADGSHLASIQPDGTVMVLGEVAADLLAFDAADANVVLAKRNTAYISAVGPDGVVSWGVRVDGTIFDLTAAGDAGLVVASVSQDIGGEIVVIDGSTGAQDVSHLTPVVAGVEMASDGLSLGLVTESSVYFYEVDPFSQPLDTPTTEDVQGLKGVAAGTILGIPIGAATVVALIID